MIDQADVCAHEADKQKDVCACCRGATLELPLVSISPFSSKDTLNCERADVGGCCGTVGNVPMLQVTLPEGKR